MITVDWSLIILFLVFEEARIPKVIIDLEGFHEFEVVDMAHSHIYQEAHLPPAGVLIIGKVVRLYVFF
jgi:hypothetical protein